MAADICNSIFIFFFVVLVYFFGKKYIHATEESGLPNYIQRPVFEFDLLKNMLHLQKKQTSFEKRKKKALTYLIY